MSLLLRPIQIEEADPVFQLGGLSSSTVWCEQVSGLNEMKKTRGLQLQATHKRFLFKLHLDLECQHTLISLWVQREAT